MKPYWIFSGLLVCCLAEPARAGRLEFWRFDANRNRLEFQTESGVQPQAQLIPDPARLVIDLPGVVLGRPAVSQPVGGAFRSLRVGQFDRQTTRIVIELAPGYTLDPAQIRFRGATPTSWSVQLPQPVAMAIATPAGGATVTTTSTSASQITDVQITPTGLNLVTSGSPTRVEIDRSRNRKRIHVDLQGFTVAPELEGRDFNLDRFGIRELELRQTEQDPPVARLTLKVQRESPDWQLSTGSRGGIALTPQGGVMALQNPNPPQGVLSLRTGQLSQTAATNPSWSTAANPGDALTSGPSELPTRLPPPRTNPSANPGRTSSLPIRVPDLPQILVPPAQAQTPVPPAPAAQPPGATVPLPRVAGKRVIVVDPGHGGPDVGAVGIGGLQETNITLSIGLEVARLLRQQGMQVYLTRRDERDVDLPPRVSLAERVNADLFVSIHANSLTMSRPDVNGLETYYFNSGRGLASTIHRSVLEGTTLQDRGVRRARFYVLRKTSMPAVLVEVGFVTGAEDARRLRSAWGRRQIAIAIARGILRYAQQSN